MLGYAEYCNSNNQIYVDLFLPILRFKEHIQNNLPRDFLTTEQFVQLRRELASVNGHNGEDAQPADDLPSGTEEITDPAKVHAHRGLGGSSGLSG